MSNFGKSLSREEMKNVKGGSGYHGDLCGPPGAMAYNYPLGCCDLTCHEWGVGDICWKDGPGSIPCTVQMT